MKVTLKDLLRHKFPMDESEQAVLLKEIYDLDKELRKKLNPPEVIKANKDDEVVRWVLKTQNTLIKEILGEIMEEEGGGER